MNWAQRRWEESLNRGDAELLERCPHCGYRLPPEIGARASFLCPRCRTRVRAQDNLLRVVCTVCYQQGTAVEEGRGSVGVAIALWFFFLIPGLIYTIWMAGGPKRLRCRHCDSPAVVPADSPRGQEILSRRRDHA